MRRTVLVLATAMLTVALYVAVSSAWLDSSVLDSDQFVATTLEAVEESSTRDAAAEIIVDELVDEFPLVALFDSTLASVFSGLLATDAIEPLLVGTASNVHRRMIGGDQTAIVMDLEPYRGLLLAPLESVAPELAALVPEDWFRTVEVLDQGVLPDLSTYHRRASTVAVIATIVSIGLIVVVALLSRRWNSALIAIGSASLLAGGVSLVLVPGARSTVDFLIEDEPSSIVVINVFNAFTRTLTERSLVMLVVGATLVVVGALGSLYYVHTRASSVSPMT